jgi:glycosyltransferase involved in cell wall biosynthesis
VNEPMLTVVVPVYNSARFLPTCIKSILSQTFMDFELILINDGSKDKSLAICRKFEKYDSRVRVINQINSGSILARKAGINNAAGRYISFVDSDDYLEKNCFDRLMANIDEHGYDIVIGNMYRVIGSRIRYRKVRYDRYFTNDYEVTGDDIRKQIVISYFDALGFPAGLLGKVYRIDLIKGAGKYQEGIIFMGDDIYLNLEVFLNAKKIRIVGACIYNYRYGGGHHEIHARTFLRCCNRI